MDSKERIGRMDIHQILHHEARQFWKTADNTFLGPSDYYVKQQLFLETHVFPITNLTDRILDIGCGNGHFTRMFSPYCSSITGLDISEKLILEAQHTAQEHNHHNVDFILIDDLMNPNSYQYDIILCMGVTSAIIDENEFLKMLRFLQQTTKPLGYLILKDMLRIDQGDEFTHSFHLNITRSKVRYLDMLNHHDFFVVNQEVLLDWPPFNFSMFVMQKKGGSELKI